MARKRSCPHSGTVYDDAYRPWRYGAGPPAWNCAACAARRTLIVVDYTLARGAIREKKLIYPYHARVAGAVVPDPKGD